MHVRSAVRSLLRMPAFAAAVVLTIALGVGATSAMFSVVYATLLRPLPYRDAGRLVIVWEKWQVNRDMKGVDPTVAARLAQRSVVMNSALATWRTESHVFEELAGYSSRPCSLTGTSEPEQVDGAVVSSQFFRVLGVRPEVGRGFRPEEDVAGQDEVVILSHRLWMRRFGGDRAIVGKTIGVDGLPHTVVGILPADFHLALPNAPRDPDVVAPLPHSFLPDRKWTLLVPVGRLKAGVTVAAAQSDMSAVVRRMAERNPRYKTRDANVVALTDEIGHDSRSALLVMFGATVCVLLIGVANIANLLLLRATARQKEVAVRTALGAGRWRLARHVLAESVGLAIAGGIGGLLIAYWGTALLMAVVPEHLFPRMEDVSVNPTVLAFGVVVSVVVGVLSGLAPAWHVLGRDRGTALNQTLNDAQRTSTISRGQRVVRRSLVTAQVAIATVLLAGAGLLMQTYLGLTRVDLGVNPERVLTFLVKLPDARYATSEARLAFQDAVLSRLQALPGVEAAGLGNSLPVSSQFVGSMTAVVEGRPRSDDREEFVNVRPVSPGILKAAGFRLAYGRFLNAADSQAHTIVVNRALVRRYWPDAGRTGPEPIGRRMQVGKDWTTIVGVVEDVKYSGPQNRAEPEAYVPLAYWPLNYIAAVVRASRDPKALAPLVRQAVRGVDADLPILEVNTLEEVASRTLAPQRFRFVLIAIFAGVAVLLATIGLYGVIAQSVAQRRQEIGIRMALGASGPRIARMVLAEGFVLAVVGVVIGVGISLAATRLLAGMLFGVDATDVPTYVAVCGFLAAIGVLASTAPAARATRENPAVVLRGE